MQDFHPKTTVRLLRSVLFLAMPFIAALGLSTCSRPPALTSRQMDSIRFGDLNVESSAFIYIAEDQKFFTRNGLNVEIDAFDTGPAAIQAMLQNQVDLVTSGEYAFINRILAGDNLSLIGSMDKYQTFYLVCRSDRGIRSPADLAGKTIGLVPHALPEFYLGRFLDLRGIDSETITVVNVNPAQWVEAISNGDVDAIVVSRVYLEQLQAKLQDRMVAWPVQSNQDAFGLVFGKTEWVTDHPDVVHRFLLSLAQAEKYAIDHPAEAQTVVQKKLNMDGAYLSSDWSNHRFSLSLDESLFAAMEDETRWMMQNGLTDVTSMPDYLKYIYMEGMKAVSPDAVNIIY